MSKALLLISALFLPIYLCQAQQPDTLILNASYASAKQISRMEEVVSSIATIDASALQKADAVAMKELSALVPNLWIPDYGSSMTSSIYVRGFGSRMDNPVLSLYIDDVPVSDKNMFDFDFLDIRRVDVLRGPQSTLYGRNSMLGVMAVSTLSPANYQGFNAELEYGSHNHVKAAASLYKGNWGLSIGYRHSGGRFTNSFNGKPCDDYDGVNARVRYAKRLKSNLHFDNIVSMSMLSQGAFPYRQIGDDGLMPVAYNDKGAYKRASVSEAAIIKYSGSRYRINSVTSLQGMSDRMDMDQDYTVRPVFTLSQRQKQITLTHDSNISPLNHPSWWKWQSGIYLMGKYNSMNAPVTFKKDGIDELILGNINKSIPESIGGHMEFMESSFPIENKFGILTANAALYHESYFNFGKWNLVAGLRLDFEHGSMDYNSSSLINYQFLPFMEHSKEFLTRYKGTTCMNSLKVLPKIAASYSARENLKFFASISEGFKAGGFNTQIFSDILQKEMMKGLMEDLGVHPDFFIADIDASSTAYKPENSFDIEAGVKYNKNSSNGLKVNAEGTVYYINCFNQQMTVFPPGKNTGRYMTNTGRSRSYGTEICLNGSFKSLGMNLSYGYTDARFVKYNDGNNDYSGNFIPYSPSSTLQASLSLHLEPDWADCIDLSVDCRAAGPIYWNESNTRKQDFYALAGAYAAATKGAYTLWFRADNIFNTNYNLFYFKSMGNEFMQSSLPVILKIGLRITI